MKEETLLQRQEAQRHLRNMKSICIVPLCTVFAGSEFPSAAGLCRKKNGGQKSLAIAGRVGEKVASDT